LGNEFEQKKESKELSVYVKIGLTVFVTFVCCILFFFMIYRYEGFASGWNKLMRVAEPITIGLVLAYLLTPVMRFCEKGFLKFFEKHSKNKAKVKKRARALSVTCCILLVLVVIALLLALIVPSLINSIMTLGATLPGQVRDFVEMLDEGQFGNTEISEAFGNFLVTATDYLDDYIKEQILPEFQNYIAQITSGVISVLKTLFNFIIGIIVMAYVMAIMETLQGQAKKIIYAIFKPKYGNIITHTVRKSSEIFGGFITGKLLDSAIIGVICYIACLILKMPSAVLVSVIIGVTNVIPFFGPFIGAIPALLLVVIQSPWHALYLLIFIIILQQVDGNIIGPKILGNSIGLSSFWIMFSTLVFGGLWGVVGMILGVPVFAVLYYIIGKIVRSALSKKKLPTDTALYVKARGVNLDTNTLRYMKQEDAFAKPESDEKTN
jgi:predicted PurR-regulated permease PerM